MVFHSILFERTEDSIKKETLEAPCAGYFDHPYKKSAL
jgi:hypothetical protein